MKAQVENTGLLQWVSVETAVGHLWAQDGLNTPDLLSSLLWAPSPSLLNEEDATGFIPHLM